MGTVSPEPRELSPRALFNYFCETIDLHARYIDVRDEVNKRLAGEGHAHGCSFLYHLGCVPNPLELLDELGARQEVLRNNFVGRVLGLEVIQVNNNPALGIVHNDWPSRGGRMVADQSVFGKVANYCIHHGGLLIAREDRQIRHIQAKDRSGKRLVRAI